MADELVDAGPVHSALDLDPRLNIFTCACGAVFGLAPRTFSFEELPLILREHRATCGRAPVSTADALRGFADSIAGGGLLRLAAISAERRVELLRAAADRLDGLEAAVRDARTGRHDGPPTEPGAPSAAAERLSEPSSGEPCPDCGGGAGNHGSWCRSAPPLPIEHDELDRERRWTLAEGAVLQQLLTGEPDTVMRLGSPAQFESLAAQLVDVVRRIVR